MAAILCILALLREKAGSMLLLAKESVSIMCIVFDIIQRAIVMLENIVKNKLKKFRHLWFMNKTFYTLYMQ